ncbi:L,D-transpeptidase family protein [Pseudogemmobacter sp. W21_MBD1_M6]|uniref:L,D-transpeptidase family protein n=1 Tax=Pseudogemmobacter sp. W21_MBD1_M6 TaxID=3240271 RepID=UPI003F97D521
MRAVKACCVVVLFLALSACSSKFKSYDGPEVTRLYVMKSDRKLHLMHHDKVLKTYKINLGFAPVGDKKIEADGKTPEGIYYVNRRNPDSAFHLSLGISYPNDVDRAEAALLGKTPGGDIFIHGDQPRGAKKRRDWTAGCIAVTDKQMEDIYAMVRDGTAIVLLP